MAIETLAAFIEKSHKEKEITWPYGLDVNLSFEGNRLKTAIKLANKKVYRAADNREEYTGMGTTAVAALVSGDVLTVGSAGDSRCYLLRGRRAHASSPATTPGSPRPSGEGILNADEIDRHPLRNVITKAVGAKDTIELDVVEHKLAPGDVVPALLRRAARHAPRRPDPAGRDPVPATRSRRRPAELIDAANEAGGKDNVSVVLLRYTE